MVARFDGGRLSSDGGVLALREIEQRLGIADRLAACMEDPRAPGRIVHGLAEIIRFRLLMIAAGYEDGNDADSLRRDPVFKLALDRLPDGAGLCSQSTISRLENLPDVRALLRMGRAMVDLYCAGFRQVPKRIVLDIDDTFDAVHGGQQLRLFNAHYDEYGFQPIVVFDGTAASSPPCCARPSGPRARRSGPSCAGSCGDPRQLAAGGDPAARRQPLLLPRGPGLVPCRPSGLCARRRADQHLAAPYHRPGGQHRRPVRRRPRAAKVRRFKEFYDGAGSWSRVERIIARVEAGPQGTDTRFIVTSLRHGRGRCFMRNSIAPAARRRTT